MGLFGKREQPRLSHQATPGKVIQFDSPVRVAKPKPAITHTFRLEMTPSDLRIILDKMKKVQETYSPQDNNRVYTWYEPGLEVEFIYKPKETEK